MVTTDDAELQAGLQSLTNQGRADTGQWLEHDRLGYNYRLDELSAAVGVAQVERIDEILAQRAAVAARYGELLAGVPGVDAAGRDGDGDVRSWFVYVVRLDPSFDRNDVMELLSERGVAGKPYLPTVHLQSYFRELGHREGECPVAEEAARATLALPFHTRLDARPGVRRRAARGGDRRQLSAAVGGVEELLRELAPQVLGALVAALRPLRRLRGRRPGGAARGRAAVAGRGRAGQPARLADHGRRAAADRRAAQRERPPPARGRPRRARSRRTRLVAPAADAEPTAERGRHADAALPVLPPGALARRPRWRSRCARSAA